MKEFKRIYDYWEKHKLNSIYLEMLEWFAKKDFNNTLKVVNQIYREQDKGGLLVPESLKILLFKQMPDLKVDFYRYVKAKKYMEDNL